MRRTTSCLMGIFLALGAMVALSGSVHAMETITFDEPGLIPLVTTDPGFTLGPVAFAGTGTGDAVFSAGDPAQFEDTYVDPSVAFDGASSLASGFVDQAAAIILNVSNGPVYSITAMIYAQALIPADFVVEGLNAAGAPVASSPFPILNGVWLPVTLSSALGMTQIRFVEYGGSPFNLDSAMIDQQQGGTVIPEPATLTLLLAAAGGLALRRRKR